MSDKVLVMSDKVLVMSDKVLVMSDKVLVPSALFDIPNGSRHSTYYVLYMITLNILCPIYDYTQHIMSYI